MKNIKMVTPEFRGSFVTLVEPRAIPGTEGKPKYQIVCSLPKDDDFWDKVNEAVTELATARWGEIPKKFRNPIKDGDEERDEFEGMNVLNCSALQRPGIVGPDLAPLMDPEELYSGAWYRAEISFFAWDHPTGGKGVSAGLENVMKIKDDEKYSGKNDPTDAFSAYAPAKKKGSLLGG